MTYDPELCFHATRNVRGDLPFFGPVASAAQQNRAAHGGRRYVETCERCGATREVLTNGPHREYGAWHPREEGGR